MESLWFLLGLVGVSCSLGLEDRMEPCRRFAGFKGARVVGSCACGF